MKIGDAAHMSSAGSMVLVEGVENSMAIMSGTSEAAKVQQTMSSLDKPVESDSEESATEVANVGSGNANSSILSGKSKGSSIANKVISRPGGLN